MGSFTSKSTSKSELDGNKLMKIQRMIVKNMFVAKRKIESFVVVDLSESHFRDISKVDLINILKKRGSPGIPGIYDDNIFPPYSIAHVKRDINVHKFYKYKNKIDVESSIVASRNSYLVKGQFSDLSIINEDQLDKEFRAFEQNTRILIPNEEFVMQLSRDVYNKMITSPYFVQKDDKIQFILDDKKNVMECAKHDYLIYIGKNFKRVPRAIFTIIYDIVGLETVSTNDIF